MKTCRHRPCMNDPTKCSKMTEKIMSTRACENLTFTYKKEPWPHSLNRMKKGRRNIQWGAYLTEAPPLFTPSFITLEQLPWLPDRKPSMPTQGWPATDTSSASTGLQPRFSGTLVVPVVAPSHSTTANTWSSGTETSAPLVEAAKMLLQGRRQRHDGNGCLTT
jgi:hypothetical protein